jgi:hypothetical protein
MQCRSKILQIQESRKIKKNEAQINRGLPNQQPIGLQPQSQHQTQNVGQSEDGDPSVPTDLDQAATIGIPTEETQQMERNQNLSTNFSWQQQQQQQFRIPNQNEYLQQVMKALAAKMAPAHANYVNANPTLETKALALQLNISPAQVIIRQQATNMLRRQMEAQRIQAQIEAPMRQQRVKIEAPAFGARPTSQQTPWNLPQIPDVPVPSSMHVTQQYGSQQAAEIFFANSDLSEPAFSLAQQNQLQYEWGIASTSQNDPIVHSHASPQSFPATLSGSGSSEFTAGDRAIQGQQHANPCVE